MADNTSFTINLVPESGVVGTTDSDIYLDLEQIDLNGEGAYATCSAECRADLEAHAGTISGAGEGVTTDLNRYLDCMTDCGEYCGSTQKIEIKVTKNPDNLNYNLSPSYGTLGDKRTEQDNYSESHNINLKSELQISRSLENLSASWDGNVWDQHGNIRNPPNIVYTPETRTFSWGGAVVVGTLRISAMETFDIWTLDIPAREDSTTDTAWDCTVRAFYMNLSTPQVETLNISKPSMDGNCGYSYSVNFDDGPDEDCWKRTITVDPCTGEVLSDTQSKVVCPEDES